MIRVQIPSDAPGNSLLVTFGTAPHTAPSSTAFALDLYHTIEKLTFEELPNAIDRAHDNIERTFEAILTDETRALFKEKHGGR